MALKPAQLKVLFYLKTLNPFGDREIELVISQAAIALGINKSSVSRALKALDDEGWIDLEIVKVKVKIKSLHPRNDVAPTQQPMHPRNSRCTHATADAPTQQPMHPRNERSPEPSPEADSETSQTIQTYSDFKQTLSEEAREGFEKFAFRKISEAKVGGATIELPERWLEKHWPSYWGEFQRRYPQGQKSGEDKGSPGAVDPKIKIIEEAIAAGELLQYQRKEEWQRREDGAVYANRPKLVSYRVQVPVTEMWLSFQEWAAGVHPDPERKATVMQAVELFCGGDAVGVRDADVV